MSITRILQLLAVLLILGAGFAAGHAYPATNTQLVANETAAWLTKIDGKPVPQRTIVITNSMYFQSSVGENWWWRNEIRLRPSHRDPYKINIWGESSGAHVLIHELEHEDDCSGPAEEGSVDAYAADVEPAWGYVFLGQQLWPVLSYPKEVALVRKASRILSHAKHWNARPAREFRRDLRRMTCTQRLAILAPWFPA